MEQKRIRLLDTTLRDGSHAVRHAYSTEDVIEIALGLESAGVDLIEITHGDGLGGSSIQYGRAAVSDEERLRAAASCLRKAKLAVLLLPGIGTQKDLAMARDCGAQVVRIATHVTEADISQQHVEFGKKLGMEVMCFLMMAHMVDPEKVLEQARLMESYGAEVVYVVDSAGAMLPDEVRTKVGLLRSHLQCAVGFHAHNNLGLAIGNSLAAIETGASIVDGTIGGTGAGAGNAALELLVAALDKDGYDTGIDLFRLLDVAEGCKNRLPLRSAVDGGAIMLGYAGVYSSFLLHAYRAAEKFNVDPRDILVELGRRKIVGGQEDMIVDVAREMVSSREKPGREGGSIYRPFNQRKTEKFNHEQQS